MVTSSAVVGSSAISSFGLQASAMAIITRWRMPPESRCGYSLKRDFADGMRTLSRSRMTSAFGLGAAHVAMAHQRFGDLESDGQARVEAGHRFLKDHGNVIAAHAAHLLFGQVEEHPARQRNAAFDLAVAARQKPHDRQRGHAFAGAGFANDRHCRLRCNIEGDVANNRRPPPLLWKDVRRFVTDKIGCVMGCSFTRSSEQSHSQGNEGTPPAGICRKPSPDGTSTGCASLTPKGAATTLVGMKRTRPRSET